MIAAFSSRFPDSPASTTGRLASAVVRPAAGPAQPADVHQQILDLASRQQRASPGPVRRRHVEGRPGGPPDLAPRGVPRACSTASREGRRPAGPEDRARSRPTITSSRSSPTRASPAISCRPCSTGRKVIIGSLPGVLSPCGHSTNGKAAGTYQTLHINLAKRGYVVLTYDPVGQGERSQFWDAEQGPVALQPELRRARRARQPALSPRHQPGPVPDLGRHARARLPGLAAGSGPARDRLRGQLGRRHAHGLHRGPRPAGDGRRHRLLHHDAPATDGQPHPGGPVRRPRAGHLRLRRRGDRPRRAAGPARAPADAPRLGPVRTSSRSRAPGNRSPRRSGSTRSPVPASGSRWPRRPAGTASALPLRTAVYAWFDRWLAGRTDAAPSSEIAVKPRPDAELLVCPDGQVNLSLRSRPFLPLAWEEFERKPKPARVPLADLLRLDLEPGRPARHRDQPDAPGRARPSSSCINGNESRDWREEAEFLQAASKPRPCGRGGRPARGGRVAGPPIFAQAAPLRRPAQRRRGEHRLQRVPRRQEPAGDAGGGRPGGDLERLAEKDKPRRIDRLRPSRCGAGGLPGRGRRAVGSTRSPARTCCSASGRSSPPTGFPINAASILPGLLQKFGDIADVLAQIAPRKVLVASGIGEPPGPGQHTRFIPQSFSKEPKLLADWLRD